MILSDQSISAAVDMGLIKIDPYNPDQLQPASYDLTLGDQFMIRPGHQAKMLHGIALPPGLLTLGHTAETITMSDHLAGRFEGRSSLGRLGLMAHITAGFIDPGFTGQITLELYNLTGEDLYLTPGMPIGQICFMTMTTPAVRPYGSTGLGSHYQGQTGPTPSRT